MSKFKQMLSEWDPEENDEYDDPRDGYDTWSFSDDEYVIDDKNIVNSIIQWTKANNKPAPVLEPDGSLLTFLSGRVSIETVDDSDYNRETGYGHYTYDKFHDVVVDELDYIDATDNPVSLLGFLDEPQNKNVLRDFEDVVVAKAQDR